MAARTLDPLFLKLEWECETRHPNRTYWISVGVLRIRVSRRIWDWVYRKIEERERGR